MHWRGVQLNHLAVAALIGATALVGLWLLSNRPDGIDGAARSGQAFVDSFPDNDDCEDANGDDDTFFRGVECLTGANYTWFNRPLPNDYAQNLLPHIEYQCLVISGTTMASIRPSTAVNSTPSELDTLMQQVADSFKDEASLTGQDCP